MTKHYSITKRAIDVALCGGGLLALMPLMGLIALTVKIGTPGPILYKGRRIGLNGRPFYIWKFRSMVVNAERLGGSATADDDPRITWVGRLLRRYKLDELPQLFNVLSGDMSIVGPRPEVQKYTDMFSIKERSILSVPPGITDWASIWNSNEAAVLEGSTDPEKAYEELIRPTKLKLQLLYVRTRSLGTDWKIIFHTFLKLGCEEWVPSELSTFATITTHRMACDLNTAK